jgi:hypothetical protein
MDKSTRFGLCLGLLGLAAGLGVFAAQELGVKFPALVYVSLLVFAGLLVLAGLSLVTPLWAFLARMRDRPAPPSRRLEVEEYIVLGQKIAEEFGSAYKPVTGAHSDVAGVYKKYASQYIPLQRSPNPSSHVRVVTLMREMANELNPIFDALDEAMPRLRGVVPLVAGAPGSLAEHYERDPDSASVEVLRKYREDLSGFLKLVEHFQGLMRTGFLGLVMKFSGESTLGDTRRRGIGSVNVAISVLDEIAGSCREAIKTVTRLLDGR